jgi:5'-methylthioadenosine phosphorylase
MEGPQFSTRAESLLYRSLGCSVIGMTNLTEARLCREAEIAYAALSLVTDYDAWRPHAAGVDAAEILAVLRDNAHVAHEVVLAAVARVPTDLLPENHALAHALVTPLDRIPAATRARLLPLLEPYIRP